MNHVSMEKTKCIIVLMYLLLGFTQWTVAQNNLVKGKVIDAKGEAILGANVTQKGTNVGTVTDDNGNFSLNMPGNTTLVISYLGYTSKEVKVNNQTNLTIELSENSQLLNEVVVVGYGTQKKETVVGAITSIGTKELVQSPQANISNALAGRLSGIFSVQSSGEPGHDASTLRIRGVGTFTSQTNGLTYDPQAPLVMVDGIEVQNYNNIDPNEVESLTVLKDASATAVYGVRGANGVILITTRRGSEGKPQISFSTNGAVTDFPSLRRGMNSYDYATAANLALAYDSYVTGSYSPLYTTDVIEKYRTHSDPIFYPDIDWYDYMLKKFTYQTQSNLNIRGGTDKVKYFVSIGYFTQDGLLNTAIYNPGYDYQMQYRRYNLRSNFDINLSKNLSLSFDISSQIGDLRNPNWSTSLLMSMLCTVPANTSPGVINNHIINILTANSSGWNPIIAYAKGWNHSYENNLNGSMRLKYKMDYLLKGLSLRGTLSYKNQNTDSKTYNTNDVGYTARETTDGSVLYIPNGSPTPVSFTNELSKSRQVYLEAGVEYANSFGKNNVTGLLLYNQSQNYNPAADPIFFLPFGYQGIVGRVTYDFSKRYLAEFDLGYNGSENFAPGKRFGFFPAYSLGWVPTEEAFFPKNKVLTYFKVRGSYGIVGNDKIGGDRFLYRPTSYSYQNGVYFFGLTGVNSNAYTGMLEGKLGNPDLTWEKAKNLDIGFDITLWNNKIGLTLDYFDDRRNNILCNRGTVPDIIGVNMPAYNLGEMDNKGYEAELTYHDKVGKFNYFVKGTYSFAHNKIIFQDEVNWPYNYQYRTGQSYGQYFGYVADGLYTSWAQVNDPNRPVYMWNNNKIQPGDIKYKDINGDGKIDANDQVPIGYSSLPEIMYGITLGGQWKGFDFSILFQGAAKVSSYPNRTAIQGFYTNTGANRDLLKSWSYDRYQQGLDIVYPRYGADNASNNYATSTYWLEDASYVRLKNAEIGYTFMDNISILKKAGISSVRIYVNGNNLLTFDHLLPGEDPESSSANTNYTDDPYPITRTFNLGLNVNF